MACTGRIDYIRGEHHDLFVSVSVLRFQHQRDEAMCVRAEVTAGSRINGRLDDLFATDKITEQRWESERVSNAVCVTFPRSTVITTLLHFYHFMMTGFFFLCLVQMASFFHFMHDSYLKTTVLLTYMCAARKKSFLFTRVSAEMKLKRVIQRSRKYCTSDRPLPFWLLIQMCNVSKVGFTWKFDATPSNHIFTDWEQCEYNIWWVYFM